MAETPPPIGDVRCFRWQDLGPAQRAAMIELIRSLGLDPDFIDTNFAVTRVAGGPWRLHLRERQRDDEGQIVVDVAMNEPVHRPLVFDHAALPDFLTIETA